MGVTVSHLDVGRASGKGLAMLTKDDQTRLLRALLSAVTDLDELPHPGPAGRVLLAAVVAGKSCSDDAVARAASMPVDAVREIIPALVDRCLHVPALLTAKVLKGTQARLPRNYDMRLRKHGKPANNRGPDRCRLGPRLFAIFANYVN